MSTATTQSQYTANGMTVAIDWHAADWNPMAVTLKAIVSTDEGVREHILTAQDTRHVVRTAHDHTRYAEAYHGMIS